MTEGEVNTHLFTTHILTTFLLFRKNPINLLSIYGKIKAKEPLEGTYLILDKLIQRKTFGKVGNRADAIRFFDNEAVTRGVKSEEG